MDEAYPISPKAMLLEIFNTISILSYLISENKNGLEDLNGASGIISFLVDISHIFI